MQVLKTLPALLVIGSVYANPTLIKREDRAECLQKTVARLTEESPEGLFTDVSICYHGDSTATNEDGYTKKTKDYFGSLGYHKCRHIGLDCFWMKAPNKWQGKGDAGSDNIAMLINNKCTYNPDDITVKCDVN